MLRPSSPRRAHPALSDIESADQTSDLHVHPRGKSDAEAAAVRTPFPPRCEGDSWE